MASKASWRSAATSISSVAGSVKRAQSYAGIVGALAAYDGDLARNIKGIRVSQHLFADLSADRADQEVAIAAENAMRIASTQPMITRPFDYGTVVTWPFVPHNWQRTRYSDGLAHGVWYGSPELETTVYDTVHHGHRFVMDSFPAEVRLIVGERRVLDVRCDALLVDLRGKEKTEPRLTDRSDYGFAQSLGRYLKDQSQNGVLAASARCKGTIAAILRPEVLSDVREKCFLTYRMRPPIDQVGVERVPGIPWMEIRPSSLA